MAGKDKSSNGTVKAKHTNGHSNGKRQNQQHSQNDHKKTKEQSAQQGSEEVEQISNTINNTSVITKAEADVNSDDHPFLGKEIRVELTDGRVVIGILTAYEGSGDMLLQNVLEQRTYKDGVKTERAQTLLAVPFKYITHIHRRLPGHEPVTNVFVNRQNADATSNANGNVTAATA